jgi:hypothetical protein
MRFTLGSTAMLLAATAGLTTVGAAQSLRLLPGVEELASDTIDDIAVAAVDTTSPVIYYNPRMARRYGPLLTRFFIAHEYGHIYHRHTRLGLADMPDAARDSVLRAQELAADCYAAALEGSQAREATEAALRFFTRLGPFRFDAEHPTGAQRAARLLMCLPGPREPVRYGRGETGVEVGPVSGEPDLVRFEVRAPALGSRRLGNEIVVWIDGQRLGNVSNMRPTGPLTVNRFGAGIHNYLVTMEVYAPDRLLQFTPRGSVSGRGQVLVRDGDRFRVDWTPGTAPALVREDAGP